MDTDEHTYTQTCERPYMHERFELVYMHVDVHVYTGEDARKILTRTEKKEKTQRQTDLKQHTYAQKIQSIGIDMHKDMSRQRKRERDPSNGLDQC